MSGSEPAQASSGTLTKLKSALGLQSTQPKGPAPINTHKPTSHSSLTRQDSFPEICSTPSDVGIFEVAHNKCRNADGTFSWRKFFFEAPGRPTTPRNGGGVGAAASAAAAGAGAAAPSVGQQ
ncbi:expressed protein [Chlorella variabilis]|uniref:Expressed protein n=1 Tax=Chlorella variabilis TaxID=554065 RepID=E1ZDI6_CHLVA|nr:expressed protein [Chlorella variabilis]EFN56231.1 expressed protein [Chlorella variabilis]|eukprot:XP_005848333.1 expressed protein [Chlorella variabilis]